eukprot:TRINITY_DN6770_c0_g1_i3.p1 TRINITY_DN6770_c0_g1~~TRINITY_DN6770_c0_g1_i3.p1  ORF type:complete len:687 (+),score=176.29 TRINITY_DN6770_c0_g1_i3:220-2061(+)
MEDALLRQVEFYFSRQNISSDKYLVSQMNKDMFVPISVIAGFKKVGALTSDVEKIASVMERSTQVTLDPSRTMLRPNFKIQRNTIILRDVPSDTPVEHVRNIFAGMAANNTPASMEGISVRADVGNTWFVTFPEEDMASDALFFVRDKTFLGHPVKARLKSESLLKSVYPADGAGAPMVATTSPSTHGGLVPPGPMMSPYYPGAMMNGFMPYPYMSVGPDGMAYPTYPPYVNGMWDPSQEAYYYSQYNPAMAKDRRPYTDAASTPDTTSSPPSQGSPTMGLVPPVGGLIPPMGGLMHAPPYPMAMGPPAMNGGSGRDSNPRGRTSYPPAQQQGFYPPPHIHQPLPFPQTQSGGYIPGQQQQQHQQQQGDNSGFPRKGKGPRRGSKPGTMPAAAAPAPRPQQPVAPLTPLHFPPLGASEQTATTEQPHAPPKAPSWPVRRTSTPSSTPSHPPPSTSDTQSYAPHPSSSHTSSSSSDTPTAPSSAKKPVQPSQPSTPSPSPAEQPEVTPTAKVASDTPLAGTTSSPATAVSTSLPPSSSPAHITQSPAPPTTSSTPAPINPSSTRDEKPRTTEKKGPLSFADIVRNPGSATTRAPPTTRPAASPAPAETAPESAH